MMPPPLAIHLFGVLRVTVRGAPLPRVRTRSVEWLLALLTLRHGRAVSRSWLAGTLWPESSGSRALQNLRDDLMRLRQALGPESGRIQSPARNSLNLDLTGAAVDVLQFDAAIQAGDDESLRSAVAVSTGPLLEDCLEEWALTERAARAEQLLAALETLAERAAGRGDHSEAIRYLRRAEALDPLRDSLPRRLMISLAAAGDAAAAIQTYRDFRLRLQEELAAVPDEATTRLFHEIRAAARHQAAQRRLAPGPAPEPPLATPKTRSAGTPTPAGQAGSSGPLPEALPRPLTSLIGREQELEEIREALRQSRLVTLVGGGGVGKTRLALEVAIRAGDASPDGAAWVELGPLADGALVLPSVAAALGLRDEDGAGDADGLTRWLVARLSDGAPLLVLDNCEHLLDAAAAAVRLLLQRCPDLRVLATSQQRLGLPGEVAWRVPSLAVPGVLAFGRSGAQVLENPSDPSDPTDPAPMTDRHHPLRGYPAERLNALLQYAAVRLFVERAAAVQPGFRLRSEAEAEMVGQICRRLDGIPLAIELAAARARVLTPQQIAERLDDRFSLLTRGARGVLPRHQTLRALIDWSYDSLPAAEATLLLRLSIFAGGWTLEAAEAVCSDFGFRVPSGPLDFRLPAESKAPEGRTSLSVPIKNRKSKIQNYDVLDLLDSLVDRSLVLVDEVVEGLRYRMLETVREYGREKLSGSGELTATRNQHRDWFFQLAVLADPTRGPEQQARQARLEAELDNLRAALAWCQEAAEAHPGGEAAEAGLRLATALSWLWDRRGNIAEGLHWLEGVLARSQGLPASLRAPALFYAADLAGTLGHREQSHDFLYAAHEEYQQVLTRVRPGSDRRAVLRTLHALAEVAGRQQDWAAVWRFCVEARPLSEALGEPLERARTLELMAAAPLAQGDLETARMLLEERLAICRTLGDRELLIHALGGMGHVECREGNYGRARALYLESMELRWKVGHRLALAQSLEDVAVLARREGQMERAIRLLAAAGAFCETFGARPPAADSQEYDRTVTEGRAALGEAVFAAAWAEGRAMQIERAIEYALGER